MNMRARPISERSVAILSVLAFISILSVLLLAFLNTTSLDHTATYYYSRSVAAQEIAMGGLNEIVSDLRQEMGAGSFQAGNPSGATYTVNGQLVYIPVTNQTMVPAQIGYNGNYTSFPSTFCRVSRASDTFFSSLPSYYTNSPFPTNRASAVSTTNLSANSRTIPPSRWNETYLFGTNEPAAFTNAPPDWVYVTRSGSQAFTNITAITGLTPSQNFSQTNQVIGRYAFVIHNQGGLIDINVAGYPTNAATYTDNNGVSGTNLISSKPNLAYADLTHIPGLTTNAVNAIISWRNAGGLTNTSGNYPIAAYNYATNGFLSFTNGDNPLLSRQDLIQYVSQLITNGTLANAAPLSYLGTFSRTLNAPSWRPTLNATAPFTYATSCETTGSTNRDFPNIRFSSSTSLNHYGDNGVATTRTVNAGDPLINRRFSLARLAWLNYNGATAGISSNAIQACFGLAWDSSNYRWDYIGSSNTPVPSIETLNQVLSENREPNFFELLKATILSGSVGQNPGTVGTSSTSGGPAGYDFDLYSGNTDRHIMQIGVNIIDQYTSSNYPTAIYFKAISEQYFPQDTYYNTVYGDKNLPLLTRIGYETYYDFTNKAVVGYYHPEIWNPHQQFSTTNVPTPTAFAVTAFGQSDLGFAGSSFHTNSSTLNYSGANSTLASVYFTDAAAGKTTSIYYNNPGFLLVSNANLALTSLTNQVPSGYVFDMYHGVPPIPQTFNYQLGAFAACPNPAAAIYSGTIGNISTNANGVGLYLQPSATVPVSFAMQYKDGAGYHPYGFLSRLQMGEPGTEFNTAVLTNTTIPNPYAVWTGATGGPWNYAVRGDPRTDRFSVSSIVNAFNGMPANSTLEPTCPTNIATATTASGYIYPGGYTYPGTYSVQYWYDSPSDAVGGYLPRATSASQSGTTNKFTFISTANEGFLPGWEVNQSTYINPRPTATDKAYYADSDGVIRPGDAFRATNNTTLYTSGDGHILYHANTAGVTNSATVRRPVILQRPFRSVGELGYTFRDLPYKTIDFWSTLSADAGLLDVFSVEDDPTVVAGKVDINTAPEPVLEAILAGSAKEEFVSTNLVSAEAAPIAAAITNAIATNGPLRNRAEIVTSLSDTIFSAAIGATNATDWYNKSCGEAPLRALSDNVDTRTWCLLIDIIAQSGKLSTTATSLNDFVVEGERHYWLHIAIDRFTGQIIDQQLEPVHD